MQERGMVVDWLLGCGLRGHKGVVGGWDGKSGKGGTEVSQHPIGS